MIFNDGQFGILEGIWGLHDVLAFVKDCNSASYEKSLKNLQDMLPELVSSIDEDIMKSNKLPPMKSIDLSFDYSPCVEAAANAIRYGRELSPELKSDLDKVLATIEHYFNSLSYTDGVFDVCAYHQLEATKALNQSNMYSVYFA